MADSKVYLLLTDTGSLLSQTIKRFTQQKYNHCSLAFDLELNQWQREHHYFCSEFVATVLTAGGVYLPDKPLSFVAPYDLVDNLPLELVFEGTLFEYVQLTKGVQLAPI